MDLFNETLDIGSTTLEEIERQAAEKTNNEKDESIEVIETSPGFQRTLRQRTARHEKLRSMTQRNRSGRATTRGSQVKQTKSDTSSNRLGKELKLDDLIGEIHDDMFESQFTFTTATKNLREKPKKNPELEGLSQILDLDSNFTFSNDKRESSSHNKSSNDLDNPILIESSDDLMSITDQNKENTAPNNNSGVISELQDVNMSEFLSTGTEKSQKSCPEDDNPVDSESISFNVDMKEMESAKMSLLGKGDPKQFSESIFSDDLFPEVVNNSSIIAEGTLAWRDNSIKKSQNTSAVVSVADTISKSGNISDISSKNTSKVIDCSNMSGLRSNNSSKVLSCFNKSSQTPIQLNVDTRQNLHLMSNWGLPKAVLAEYHKKGITEMFEWQCECLSNTKVLFDGSNLVYSAPTSAGKTLVSEILMTKIVTEKRKKALMILPFVSVVREKMNYLQDLLTPAGLRVEGFFGGYHPPGGFEKINIAICTIEKANSIINRLLETNSLGDIGVIVVDEVHLIADSGRGYILELLLAKVMYMCAKNGIQIQIITMSATLPNLSLLQKWLKAELFHTSFRPVELKEMIKIGNTLYDSNLQPLRQIMSKEPVFAKDHDNVGQLCLETLLEGCSVLIFCPGKDWCEELARNIARIIHEYKKLQTENSKKLTKTLQDEAINDLKLQLSNSPGGLEQSLDVVLTYACAFHHAGLTSEEREIIETGFKQGVLKIIVATSTLSSGVNLPARRVVIRSPMFGGKTMDGLTYKQMIGRAGRKGKDTLGESILICTEAQKKAGESLVSTKLQPLSSCLDVNDHVVKDTLKVLLGSIF